MNNSLLLTPNWPVSSHIRAFTTLRHSGFSEAPFASFNLALHVGDKEADVRANREALTKQAHLPSEPKWINQVHSNIAVLAETINASESTTADASYTKQPNIICTVLTADCLPILVTNQKGTEVAAIHAGWRGLANGIIENTLHALQSSSDSSIIWIGPSISQPYYEVERDFYDAFTSFHTEEECHQAFHKQSHTEPTKWLANVPLLAYQRLIKLGVQPHNIYLSHECTYAHPERYFSYRRDGITGRIASMIFIAS